MGVLVSVTLPWVFTILACLSCQLQIRAPFWNSPRLLWSAQNLETTILRRFSAFSKESKTSPTRHAECASFIILFSKQILTMKLTLLKNFFVSQLMIRLCIRAAKIWLTRGQAVPLSATQRTSTWLHLIVFSILCSQMIAKIVFCTPRSLLQKITMMGADPSPRKNYFMLVASSPTRRRPRRPRRFL